MRTGLAGSKIPAVNLKKTGESIRRMRKEAGISVRELQVIFGFTNPQAIYSWQSGNSLPTIDNLIILAAVLGTTIDEIIAVDTYEQEETEISCFYPQIKMFNTVS
jgi:transcriptional regulator with XRE-family HTH domain